MVTFPHCQRKKTLLLIFLLALLTFPCYIAAIVQEYPDITYDGTQFFLVWQESEDGSHPYIYGQQVNMSGELIGTDPVQISLMPDTAYAPAAVLLDDNYIVAWNMLRRYHFAALINQSLGIIQNNLLINNCSMIYNGYAKPSLAFDGNNFLSVSVLGYPVNCHLFTPTGAPLDSVSRWCCDASQDAQVAFGTDNYLVVWKNFG